MPLKRCTENGKSGWKWGNSGKCYTGKDAKKKAIKQGIAIEGPDKFKEKAADLSFASQELVEAAYESGWSIQDIDELKSIIKSRKEIKISALSDSEPLYTSVEQDHFHYFFPGDRMTSMDYGHAHPITENGEILSVQGHTHKRNV